MKKLFLSLFLTMIGVCAYPQKETTKGFTKLAAKGQLSAYGYFKTTEDYKAITQDPLGAFNSYQDTLTNKDQFIISNKDRIVNSFEIIKNEYGGQYANARFLNIDGGVSSLNFPTNTKSIVYANLIYTSVFNSINVNLADRCSRVAKSLAMPFLARISEYFLPNQYIGVSVAYGSKDFTAKYDTESFDILIIIVEAKSANQYFNMEISEDEFISKCNFFLKDAETRHNIMKKINID